MEIKTFIRVLSCLLLIALVSPSIRNHAVEVTSDYRIVSSPSATKTEQYAAQELQGYLSRISGWTLPIVHEAVADAKLIYVGFDDVPSSLLGVLQPDSFGKEEYIIQQTDDALLIAGGQPRGTLYGVIGLLKDHFGCRWYTRDVTKVPTTTTLRVDDLPDRQAPTFEYREPWYRGTYDTDFAVHNRLNPSTAPVPEDQGGSFICTPSYTPSTAWCRWKNISTPIPSISRWSTVNAKTNISMRNSA